MTKKIIIKDKEKFFQSSKNTIITCNPNKIYDMRPSWIFRLLCPLESEIYSKYNFLSYSIDEIKDLFEKLQSFEKRFWKDIFQDKKQNHFIAINNFNSIVQKRLEEIYIQVEALFSIRLTGKIRLYGFFELSSFCILFFDNEHELCPSIKKHT